jgi:hypothetical protein
MPASPWNLSLAVALIVLGAVFAWYERRTAQLLPKFSARLRPFLVTRSRRRIRVASLFIMIGVLMACGHWTDLNQHPVRFLIISLLTVIFSIALLAYGVSDFYATRAQRVESGRRALTRLADVKTPWRVATSDADDTTRPQSDDDGA